MKKLLALISLIPVLAQAAPAPLIFGPQNKAQLLQKGLRFPQSTTPSSPSAGFDYLYFKSDDHLYCKNSAGTETQVDGGGGGGITALTGDVTASGTGSVATTVAAVGGSTAANVHAAELLANAATNTNTNSTIVKRDGSGNFTAGTITAALTGAASLNVLKAGDTMTGPLNMPAGSAGTCEITGGTGNTGLFFPTSATAAFSSAGTEVWRTGANGFTIGNTTLQTAGLYIKPLNTTADRTILLENASNTKTLSIDAGSDVNAFVFALKGGNSFMAIGTGQSATKPANWIGFTDGGTGSAFAWPIAYETASANGNITAFTSFTKSNGASVNGYPIFMIENRNSTVNTIECYGIAGNSHNPMGLMCTRHLTQTSGSEDGEIFWVVPSAGTRHEYMKLGKDGAMTYAAYTTAGFLRNDTSGVMTSYVVPDAILTGSATSISGSLATVAWATTVRDTDSAYSAGTYTVPTGKGGVWHVDTNVQVTGTIALNSELRCEVQVGGTAIKTSQTYAGGAMTAQVCQISADLVLAAADTVRLQILSGATGPAITNTAAKTFFNIRKVD